MRAPATEDLLSTLSRRLVEIDERLSARYPGEQPARQPVHTVYGGAHLFRADVAARLGARALESLDAYAKDAATFARALGLSSPDIASRVYTRVREKLAREPVEDYRVDFEDGYGHRPDDEEDEHARAVALELANGMSGRTLPPFIGIRIKSFGGGLGGRALRTLDRVLSTLAGATGGAIPPEFRVTLPKVVDPEQVTVLADACDALESAYGFAPGSLKVELMVETPQAILAADGGAALRRLVDAARGRCRAAHFGTYDYTAGLGIAAAEQRSTHAACDFARHVMQVSLAGTGVALSDGATNVMPVGPHRPVAGGALTPEQRAENEAVVHAAWRLHYSNVRHSLAAGLYQGWDLHPAQLPARYAAVHAFFLEGLEAASTRLRHFVEKAAVATRLGHVFDDAATGQGLLNHFARGLACGALAEEDLRATGLTLDELRGRSFLEIAASRRGSG